MRLDTYCVERSMIRRILAGCLVILSIAIVPVGASGAGRGGRAISISSGLRGSPLRPAFRAASPSGPLLLNRGQSAFRATPRSPFGFGFRRSRFAYGFPFGPFGLGFWPSDFGAPLTPFDLGVPGALGNCASFYCTYYDPSEATYGDPYYRPWPGDPGTMIGLLKPAFIHRAGCDSEAVTVHSEGGEERTIKVVRC
jgi:hypothetical protein